MKYKGIMTLLFAWGTLVVAPAGAAPARGQAGGFLARAEAKKGEPGGTLAFETVIARHTVRVHAYDAKGQPLSLNQVQGRVTLWFQDGTCAVLPLHEASSTWAIWPRLERLSPLYGRGPYEPDTGLVLATNSSGLSVDTPPGELAESAPPQAPERLDAATGRVGPEPAQSLVAQKGAATGVLGAPDPGFPAPAEERKVDAKRAREKGAAATLPLPALPRVFLEVNHDNTGYPPRPLKSIQLELVPDYESSALPRAVDLELAVGPSRPAVRPGPTVEIPELEGRSE
jgi:hypothetical protein